jgi:hypothetical protein
MTENFFNLEKKPEKNGNFLFIIVPIILLIVIFGLVIISNYVGDGFIASTSEKITEERNRMISIFNGEDQEEEQASEEGEEDANEEEEFELAEEEDGDDDEISIFNPARENYRQVAEKGEGLTHLARKATTSYMNENDINLTDEERIYVEDYIQKEVQKEKGVVFLDIGDNVDFSSDLIEEAVNNANDLTEVQLNNLSQYTAFVSF